MDGSYPGVLTPIGLVVVDSLLNSSQSLKLIVESLLVNKQFRLGCVATPRNDKADSERVCSVAGAEARNAREHRRRRCGCVAVDSDDDTRRQSAIHKVGLHKNIRSVVVQHNELKAGGWLVLHVVHNRDSIVIY